MPTKSATPKPAAKPPAKPAARSAPKPATPPASIAAAPPVTLKHLAAKLADTEALPKKQAETLMDDVIGLIVSHLKAGDRLRLAGFGTCARGAASSTPAAACGYRPPLAGGTSRRLPAIG